MTTDRQLRRAYARAHPVTLWFSIGVMLTGAVSILAPDLTTGTSLILPDWLRLVFNVCWVIGGGTGVLGILRAKAGLEAAGMTLVSASLAAYTVLIVEAAGFIASVVFVGALAIGTGLRAHLLARGI